ncbi:nucleotidyltransferase [Bacillus manliponensis]|uniref:nucleotidyltransferase n=1 Tax=Bacillus manliponensis TaxID=574376 RepID=UPI0035131163
MKASGIIVEYNPFHNGHAYHVQQSKKLTDSDVLIAVMSGPFLQRGEPALISKWARAKMALCGGIDIVVELPYAYATQRAETFANGAISILNALNVSEVCFGSESGNIQEFHDTVSIRQQEKSKLDTLVQQYMKTGMSYAKANSEAFSYLQNTTNTIDITQPNNILGLHYTEAIYTQNNKMKAQTIKRFAAHYHDEIFYDEKIASATSIRKQLFSGDEHAFDAITPFVPKMTKQLLEKYIHTYGVLHNWEQYFPFFKYRLMTMSPLQLKNIYEVEEGLEHRILSLIRETSSFSSFMKALKTKRYTWTRLQRVCTHILTNTTKEDMLRAEVEKLAPYIRLLGMSQKGQTYISHIKKQLPIPLLTHGKTFQHPMFKIDQKASDIYCSILKAPLIGEQMKQDITRHPIRYDEETQNFL